MRTVDSRRRWIATAGAIALRTLAERQVEKEQCSSEQQHSYERVLQKAAFSSGSLHEDHERRGWIVLGQPYEIPAP